jgi:hypothetical protein
MSLIFVNNEGNNLNDAILLSFYLNLFSIILFLFLVCGYVDFDESILCKDNKIIQYFSKVSLVKNAFKYASKFLKIYINI